MTSPKPFHIPTKNRLLAAIPDEEYQRLLPYLEFVHLAKNKIVYEAGDTTRHAYFLTSGMASLLSITEHGEMIEVAMVGNEGMIGIPIVLQVNKTPHRVLVQIPADAMRIKADLLRAEFNQGGQLHHLLLRYTHALFAQLALSSACNHFHTIEQRLARWLLVTRDCVKSDTFHLTQEFLSLMLGAPRTSITTIAGALQKTGLIRYSRGKITILDRQALEETACECYEIIKEEIDQFIAA